MKPGILPGLSVGGHPLRQYSSPAAAELADVWSRIADLDLALAALERLQALHGTDSDLFLSTSLYCAMAIYYRRCFASGVRQGLHLPTEELVADAKAAHDLLLAVANKHIAHSVNSFEEVKVSVALEHCDGELPRLLGVTPVMMRLSSHNPEQLEKFSALIGQMRKELTLRLDELGPKVANELASLPVEELLSLPCLEFRQVDDALADKRR